ncbi:MAG: hypothetical protein LBH47_00565 [Christensenellaceae bacterium]|jgi:hypothetical protein|nr:hypothetical protein [Christensenellaceae bacterium]
MLIGQTKLNQPENNLSTLIAFAILSARGWHGTYPTIWDKSGGVADAALSF